jgi:hypothetical protein
VDTRRVQLGDRDGAPRVDAPASDGVPPPFLYYDQAGGELTSGRGRMYVRGGHTPAVDADPWIYYPTSIW